jgi:hypothetical protein
MKKLTQAAKFITIAVMAACTVTTLMDRIPGLKTLPLANFLGVYTMAALLLSLVVYTWILPEQKEEKPVGNYFKNKSQG